MVNKDESSNSRAKKSTSCGHFMPSWDNCKYCFKCRDSNNGNNFCTLKNDCLLCASFSEEQKHKLTIKHSKGKKSVKGSSLDKSKIDNSILDEDDNPFVTNADLT